MLVAAMAFAWCVISAEKSVPAIPAPQARAAVGSSPAAGQRTPIRSAIPADVIAFAKTLMNLPMGAELRITVSVGVVAVEPAEAFESALARADAALYRAKGAGRNLVVAG